MLSIMQTFTKKQLESHPNGIPRFVVNRHNTQDEIFSSKEINPATLIMDMRYMGYLDY